MKEPLSHPFHCWAMKESLSASQNGEKGVKESLPASQNGEKVVKESLPASQKEEKCGKREPSSLPKGEKRAILASQKVRKSTF